MCGQIQCLTQRKRVVASNWCGFIGNQLFLSRDALQESANLAITPSVAAEFIILTYSLKADLKGSHLITYKLLTAQSNAVDRTSTFCEAGFAEEVPSVQQCLCPVSDQPTLT